MKNFIAAGSALTLTAPAAVASGAVVQVGAIVGVANGSAAAGQDVVLSVAGVFDLPKAAEVITTGAVVYWDNTAKVVTVEATGNTKIGVAVEAVGSTAALLRVRLNGSF
ncbi:MAG: DUF2190 family protein [Paracoccaceae bacterium]